ncbi:MAG: 30S ribosomal protein S12 methylthiotransferase RimO [Lentisphaeria bacterium]|nr:30S ribosomal protein S12 methylthiotransferase RimO [Lentisphaeria bacterium]
MNKSKQRSLYLVSLGCPKNLVDSEVIAGNLLSNGAAWAYTPDEATVYVINTCAFLPEAREEAACEIEQAVEWKSAAPQERTIVVCGCLSQYDKDGAFAARFPEVDLWAGVDDLERLNLILDGKAEVSRSTGYLYSCNTPLLPLTLEHIAYLKIADGCNNICSYCAIPSLRGALRSRPLADIVQEAENCIANGAKELIIVAQDITAFGADRPEANEDLPALLTALDALEGDFGIRLLYTHPAHYTDAMFEVMGRMKHLIPYVDIPLQHIDDKILKAMNRHVDSARIREVISSLRKAVPGITIRTTFITGLPGEGEEEFARLEKFIREMKFDRLGVFPYSPEPGTPAAVMPGQVPLEVAEERAAKLMTWQRGAMKRANKKLIGRTMKVLVDAVEENWATARGSADAPDIDNAVFVENISSRVRPGSVLEVEIIDTDRCDLVATVKKGKRK